MTPSLTMSAGFQPPSDLLSPFGFAQIRSLTDSPLQQAGDEFSLAVRANLLEDRFDVVSDGVRRQE